MFARMMTWLHKLLYRGEFTLEPGVFETFLSGVAVLPETKTRR